MQVNRHDGVSTRSSDQVRQQWSSASHSFMCKLCVVHSSLKFCSRVAKFWSGVIHAMRSRVPTDCYAYGSVYIEE